MIKHIDETEGILTLEVGGAERTLCFNMKTAMYLSWASKEAKKSEESGDSLAIILFAALMSNKKANNLPDNFDLETASLWFLELENEEMEVILAMNGFLVERIEKVSGDKVTQKAILERNQLKMKTSMNGKQLSPTL